MIRDVPAADYLETLNPEQRRAVEHGVREQDCKPGLPLLVIAGVQARRIHWRTALHT